MLYQALPVRECRSGAEVRETYREAQRRLGVNQVRSCHLPASQVAQAEREAEAAPIVKTVAAAILSLDDIPSSKVAAQDILNAVAAAHRISLGDLRGPERRHKFAFARHHAVALLTAYRSDLSTPLIGRLMNRDHTTIINSRRQWPRAAPRFVREAEEIRAAIGLVSPYVDNADNSENNHPPNDDLGTD